MEEKIKEIFKKYNLSYEWEISADLPCVVIIYVKWGDWKHDHIHCDYLVKEYLKEKDFMLTGSNNQITESDETDSYSSIHTYYVCIDKDMGQKLSYLINGN